ncbi:aromatic alcohol reductase [Aspergillus puulaauensis]|uniref:NAD(P)-binding domain-containing protein n=1 Tax=Aspergillus puulaauensis TaxID=1220207 RepID=A0A7R7XHL4_9EURO|nr:uncharacterized protein APUU_22007S [Aspergillus puulaauensis]BCS21575.1 hypothetical protein APUU_22007S [Aspergillus puulaauensis]
MATFQKVALLGKGALGSVLLTELLKAQYTVTVLTRSIASLGDLPTGATAKEVDYASVSSLTAALQGHDIVISTVSPSAIPLQKPAIDAAIQAGVKRFIPAEFGAMTSDPEGKKLPFHAPAVEIHEYLAAKADADEIEYTAFAVGGFLEMLFTVPLVVDFEKRAVALYDGGVHGFSVSRLSTVAKAVVASLGSSDETRNRLVRVHDTVLTQRKVYDIVRKWTPGETWTETQVDAEAAVQSILGQLAKGFHFSLVPALFAAAFMSGKYGGEYEGVDNELLGLGLMSDEEVEEFGLALRAQQ